MKEIYSTKELNPSFYMVLGVDDSYPVLYVYKDDELFDYHISVGCSFTTEMENTINCYIQIHGHEPTISDIIKFRSWFKLLKKNKLIN